MDNPQSDAYLVAGKDALKAFAKDPFGFASVVAVELGRMMLSVEFNRKDRSR